MTVSDFWNLKATDIVQLIGTVVMIWVVGKAPAWAVNAQWQLQLKKEDRDRRLWIFKTLMRTRAAPLSADHVQALNLIDVEFCSDAESDKAVREAWRKYREHLSIDYGNDTEKISAWNLKGRDLLAELLNKMGAALNYNFDFTYIKENGYYPRGHGELEAYAVAQQKGWAEIVQGERALKMEITNLNQPAPQQGYPAARKMPPPR